MPAADRINIARPQKVRTNIFSGPPPSEACLRAPWVPLPAGLNEQRSGMSEVPDVTCTTRDCKNRGLGVREASLPEPRAAPNGSPAKSSPAGPKTSLESEPCDSAGKARPDRRIRGKVYSSKSPADQNRRQSSRGSSAAQQAARRRASEPRWRCTHTEYAFMGLSPIKYRSFPEAQTGGQAIFPKETPKSLNSRQFLVNLGLNP
jgi:hypothetical protein